MSLKPAQPPVRIDGDPAVVRAAWKFPSRTVDGLNYDVALFVDARGDFYDCTCPAFTYRDSCRHVTDARALLAQERAASRKGSQ